MACVYCEASVGVTIPIGSGLLAHRACFIEADRRSEAMEREGARLDHRILGEFPILTSRILSGQWMEVDTSMAACRIAKPVRRSGPTARQIADRLGLSVSAVQGRIRRGTIKPEAFALEAA
jgi:hypothetical protein